MNLNQALQSVSDFSFMDWVAARDFDAAIDASRIAIVVAHPDDETIGCGGLLALLDHVTLVVVTDGAPRDGGAALRAGFASPAAYATARAEEFRLAMRHAGVKDRQIIELAIADGEVWTSIPAICHRLTGLFAARGVDTVLTHAFEGGHSDHDGTAFCVHRVAEKLGASRPELIEMPFYHSGAEGPAAQLFCDNDQGCAAVLPQRLMAIKASMMAAYASQARTLGRFDVGVERFRRARNYDFHQPPNRGKIHYPLRRLGLGPGEWGALVRTAAIA